MRPSSHAAWASRCVAGCDDLSIDLEGRVALVGGRRLAEGDLLTLDGATGSVILGAVELVPARMNEDLETILAWADSGRRLQVHANADTPEDAAKAREFGAEGIGLCRTEHMFFGEERLPVVQEMILADDERPPRRRWSGCCPSSSATSRASSRRWRACRSRSACSTRRCTSSSRTLDEATDRATMRERADRGAARGEPDARACAAAGSASSGRRSTRCRCARSCAPPWPSRERLGAAPRVEIMDPLVAFPRGAPAPARS